MFLWPFVLFNSAASFTKQDFESMDSTLFFLATTFSGFPLYFPRYSDPFGTRLGLFMWFILKQEDELSICANSQRGEGVCPTCGRLRI
jgi:hypothetical protein